MVDAVMTAYLQVHSKRCVSDSCDGSTTLWRAWTGENALAASWLGGKKKMHVVMTLCGMAVMVVPTVFWCFGIWGMGG